MNSGWWGRLLLNRLLREHKQNLDELASQCQKILNTEYSEKLDELYRLGGTSGGARPKINWKSGNSYSQEPELRSYHSCPMHYRIGAKTVGH